MTKIKICGLKREEDIGFVNIAKPDYIGFVFAGEKRKIDFNTATKLKSLLNKEIQTVGVFVNIDVDNILNLCRDCIIDLVQLHGDEDELYVSKLKEKVKQPIIKVVRVKEKIRDIKTKADFTLFDMHNDFEYGGCGKVFDWSLIRQYKQPFFLAGGLNKDNIEKALTELKPYCIDLSSGVETDGIKDLNKIKEIIQIVRKYSNTKQETI
ncbi:N-(5'-phosphoribosyl)anthranilate isomerase [Endomicrobiia bacterium]|nr:N-(5'-phosphoribosyl)anthranilate isomerase [Endomicrobiia bacterium]GHT56463.1 N-(5'-phosphoribosyl)anthranilate isomerase [Endomicrobiia bacterium]